MVDLGNLKDQLTKEKPCKGVFYNSTSGNCPTIGTHNLDDATRKKMEVTAEDLQPIIYLNSVISSLNGFLEEKNITCTAEFTKFNVSNLPIYHYSTQPTQLTINSPFGNGSYRQAGNGIKPRLTCPTRDNFLDINASYTVGTLGANKIINPTCSAGTKYEYVGMDRTVSMNIKVKCAEKNLATFNDGKNNFEPLTLEFILKIDMMNDCDPPDDTATTQEIC